MVKKERVIKIFQPYLILLLALLAVGGVAILVCGISKLGYHITYAATRSMPQGFYLVIPAREIKRYDIVEFYPPESTMSFLRAKKWSPRSGLLLKYVMGMPGDHICKKEQAIWINNQKVGRVWQYYAPGKLLPQRDFCEKLIADHYLLLSTEIERSYDGRYFGPIGKERIVGKAIKICPHPSPLQG